MDRGALFDETAVYRYTLDRRWERGGSKAAFVMLNPSTADAFKDDPTITRCINFAKRFGHSSLVILNLFALRSTDPKKLKEVDDPVGPENDYYIEQAIRDSNQVICGWGVHGDLHGRDLDAWKIIRRRIPNVFCLGRTKAGHPKHPLYLKSSTGLERFRPPREGLIDYI